MAKAISLKDAKMQCSRSQGKPIKVKGFEQRDLTNDITVNVLYFVCKYEEIGFEYRMQVFVNGIAAAGLILSPDHNKS